MSVLNAINLIILESIDYIAFIKDNMKISFSAPRGPHFGLIQNGGKNQGCKRKTKNQLH